METQQIEGLIEYVEGLQGSQIKDDEEIILFRRLRNALDTKLKNLFSESENKVEVKLSMFDLSVGAVTEAAARLAIARMEQRYYLVEKTNIPDLIEIPDVADARLYEMPDAEADDEF